MARVPRLAPGWPLPPYGFVPGYSPHPERDPRGHGYGADPDRFGAPPAEADWSRHEPWLHTLDLFNHGYYWEAHEGFEAWWRQVAVDDPRRSLFQGLVWLAAAGVKARARQAAGVRKHALRAAEAFASVGDDRRLGLDLPALIGRARELHDAPPLGADPPLVVEAVLGTVLVPFGYS